MKNNFNNDYKIIKHKRKRKINARKIAVLIKYTYVFLLIFFISFYLYNIKFDKDNEDIEISKQESAVYEQPVRKVNTVSVNDINVDIIKVEVNEEIELIQKLSAERYYAYSKLNKKEQELYRSIYQVFSNHKGEITANTLDVDTIDKVFNCIAIDNPEFFYVKGYNLISYTKNNKLVRYDISGIYAMKDDRIEYHQKKTQDIVEQIIKNIPDTNDEYIKIKYVYDYIIKNTEYVKGTKGNQTYLSVFESGKSVCQGYAKAFQYLLTKMDIFCTFVQGTTDTGEPHVWNLVRSNGEYYYVDVTWGDTFYNIDSINAPEVNYDYLCITKEDIEKNHKIDMPYELPECTNINDSYYVRNGLYFDVIDVAKLAKIFEQNSEYIMIKCADKYIYEGMMDYLFNKSHVFDYIGKTEISYSCLEDNLEIIIVAN